MPRHCWLAAGVPGAIVVQPTLSDLLLRLLKSLVAVADGLLLVGSAGALVWFIYRIYLRRVWRARRIANIRLKRMLEEKNKDGEV
jgi:hypothetical protein